MPAHAGTALQTRSAITQHLPYLLDQAHRRKERRQRTSFEIPWHIMLASNYLEHSSSGILGSPQRTVQSICCSTGQGFE